MQQLRNISDEHLELICTKVIIEALNTIHTISEENNQRKKGNRQRPVLGDTLVFWGWATKISDRGVSMFH